VFWGLTCDFWAEIEEFFLGGSSRDDSTKGKADPCGMTKKATTLQGRTWEDIQ
jgi:hypothetical protein